MRRHALLGVTLACALTVPAVAQTQDEHFKDGMEAQKARRWQQVAERMRAAIKEDRQESARKVGERMGGIFGGVLGGGTEYLPHYFLGDALFNLEDCVGAVVAWAESEQQGIVARRADLCTYSQGLRDLRKSRSHASGQVRTDAPADDSAGGGRRCRRRLGPTMAQANPDVWRAEDSLRERYERVTADVQAARAKLAAAGRARSSRDFADAATGAENARASAEALGVSLAAAVAARATVTKQARDVEQLIAAAGGARAVRRGPRCAGAC